jgi:hypothetical protein
MLSFSKMSSTRERGNPACLSAERTSIVSIAVRIVLDKARKKGRYWNLLYSYPQAWAELSENDMLCFG